MKSNIVIYSENLNQDDIRTLLQAIRDCEQKNFKSKEIGIAVYLPEMKREQCQELLNSIKPPFLAVSAFNQGTILTKG